MCKSSSQTMEGIKRRDRKRIQASDESDPERKSGRMRHSVDNGSGSNRVRPVGSILPLKSKSNRTEVGKPSVI